MVGHQVIVNCMRYLIECLDEEQILAIDRRGDVPNCGVTSYRFDEAKGNLVTDLVNFVAPLREAGAPVTREPDVPAGAATSCPFAASETAAIRRSGESGLLS